MVRIGLLWVVLLLGAPLFASEPLRIAVLDYGTVNWELDVISHHGLIDIERVPVASPRALAVQLQGGAADIMVGDWIWVARQRAAKRHYTFHPYSMAVGGLLKAPDAPFTHLADLSSARLGIAGGPLDKSWLLLRALVLKEGLPDLVDTADIVHAAPPLLNQLALDGDVPVLINYWHYAARLKAAGFETWLEIGDVLEALDIGRTMPLLGWIYHQDLDAERLHPFLQASAQAKRILLDSDAEWQRLRPLMKVDDDATFIALREAWRRGVPHTFGAAERNAAAATFAILGEVGGEALNGGLTTLPEGTFDDDLVTVSAQ